MNASKLNTEELNLALARWPRAHLAHLPTPLDKLVQFSTNFPGHQLYFKRDDCTGLAMGGNKARLLEFYLGHALQQKCNVILSTGAVQSNYMRQLAAAAAKLGLECHIQLEKRVQEPTQAYLQSGNVLLDKLFGAHIHHFEEGEDEFDAGRQLSLISEDLIKQGKKPYIVPLAPVETPRGALGYVDAAQELALQLSQQSLSVDLIVVGSGSSLTHAGLLTGLRFLGLSTPVLGACVRRNAELQTARVLASCCQVEKMLGCGQIVQPNDVWCADDALAPGYGKASLEVFNVIKLMANQEGILIDPVYTAKTVACTQSLINTGELSRFKTIVMIHTGGTPALFAYQDELAAALKF